MGTGSATRDRRIRILPDAVANQIAAGEVVERPASVVKELVENALDARASRVEVAVEQGGKRRIRVTDDGAGMGREDALLSLDRHATSKIRQADDLRRIGTFGFRGEALPSIASVSRMTLETHDGDGEAGTRIRVVGGAIRDVSDQARTRGTTVDVETLFFNAPARARFLRSTRAETRAVSDEATALALANPRVALSLRSDDRTLLELPRSENLAGRVAALWGDDAAGALIPLAGEGGGLELRGLVQRPDRARPGFRRAHLFVNGRPFRDAGLLAAADRGYRTTIPEGHRPWLFLYLRVPEGAVDVNVHPTKAEVRFRDRAGVERMIEECVRRVLEGEDSAALMDPQLSRPTLTVREPAPDGRGRDGNRIPPDEGQMALFVPGGSDRSEGDDRGARVDDGRPAGDGTGGRGGAPGAEGAREVPRGAEEATAPRLWQLHRSYIMAETREGLLVIDQHAAHERILFERIMRTFQDGDSTAQTLLFPLTLRLSRAEYREVEELSGLLARTGFEVEGFGGDTIIVRAVPDPHPYFDPERCLREMLEELVEGSPELRSARNQHERVAMSFACQAAIKAGQELDAREMRELFDQLFATRLPWHDVHGRPTTVRLRLEELERKFGR